MLMTTSANERTFMVQNYNLEGALAVLTQGGLMLHPTDTIWSIGCDATNAKAIENLLQLKRPEQATKLEVLVDSVEMLRNYVKHLHPRIETLLVYHLRPLTIIFDQVKHLPESIKENDLSVAFRVVQDDYCRKLIAAFGKPLVASYACVGCKDYPANFGAVSSEIIQGVDFVTRHRQHEKIIGKPSVMVRLTEEDELEFLRD